MTVENRTLVRPPRPGPAVIIRPTVNDRLLQHVPVPVAFFFEQPLSEEALCDGLARALPRSSTRVAI